MSDALKPCPFCGCGDADMPPVATVDSSGNTVICTACSALGPSRQSDAEAIAAWNRRVPAPDLVEALKKADRAIQAAYAQSDAEWRNHDKIAEKHCAVVREGTDAIRTALSKALGEGEGQ